MLFNFLVPTGYFCCLDKMSKGWPNMDMLKTIAYHRPHQSDCYNHWADCSFPITSPLIRHIHRPGCIDGLPWNSEVNTNFSSNTYSHKRF